MRCGLRGWDEEIRNDLEVDKEAMLQYTGMKQIGALKVFDNDDDDDNINPWTANCSYSRSQKIGHPVLITAIVILVHAVCYGRFGLPIDTSWGCRFVKPSLIGSFAF